MQRLTGFYNLKKLNLEQLRAFFTDAVALAYDTKVQILDCNKSWRRQDTNEKSVQDMLDGVSLTHHNVCINRNIQPYNRSNYGEVGYCTLGDPDYFLYCFLSLDNLKVLTDKYSLIME